MLMPAICYKAEIEDALKKYFYTNEMLYYVGGTDSYLIEVVNKSERGQTQWAVIDTDKKLIGYIGYYIDLYESSASCFGAFSFDMGNPIMGKELFTLMTNLVDTMHRVEFRAVEGNPAIRGYDRFLVRHSDIGTKHVFRDVIRDAKGQYHDEYIYEFVNKLNSYC